VGRLVGEPFGPAVHGDRHVSKSFDDVLAGRDASPTSTVDSVVERCVELGAGNRHRAAILDVRGLGGRQVGERTPCDDDRTERERQPGDERHERRVEGQFRDPADPDDRREPDDDREHAEPRPDRVVPD